MFRTALIFIGPAGWLMEMFRVSLAPLDGSRRRDTLDCGRDS